MTWASCISSFKESLAVLALALLALGCSSSSSDTDRTRACAEGEQLCEGKCTNVSTNPSHCGDCTTACGAGQSCVESVCIGDETGTGGGASTGGDGSAATGGNEATGGSGQTAAGGSGETTSGGSSGSITLEPFSFFVTSLEAIRRLSGNQNGFGGDLRYGEDTGLAGADKICTEIAEFSMPGSGVKDWRAFLSTSTVDAIDRVGEGPWYDRLGRVVALTKTDLLNTRPANADPEIVDDLPNEYGIPNHDPDLTGQVDNHDFLTGSNPEGRLYNGTEGNCNDWTSLDPGIRPRVGHSWPGAGFGGGGWGGGFDAGTRPGGGPGDWGDSGADMGDMAHWVSALDENGCAPGINLDISSVPDGRDGTVGGGGGYGGFYCFALQP